MSVISESSSYEQAITLISEMPFADKLRLNVDLASFLKKEGKSGVVGKAAKKEKKAKDPSIKRTAGNGTLAWFAFVKHCKAVFPERFTECTKEPERLTVCKAVREENEQAYTDFCNNFKSGHSEESTPSSPVAVLAAAAPAAPAPAAPAPPAAKAAPVLTAKEKLEKLKAAKAAVPAPAPVPVAKAEKPKKETKKAAPAKKEVKKTEVAPVAEEAPMPMPKKEIDGVEYWFDPETNGLYSVLDGGFGAWVGFFQPENDDEPIRFTESPADE